MKKLLSTLMVIAAKLKYVVVVFSIFLINGVLDEHSWLENYKRQVEMDQVRQGIAFYSAQYEELTRQYNSLSQPSELERVAREKYYMKRPGEDVFIIPETYPGDQAPEELDTDSITLKSLMPW